MTADRPAAPVEPSTDTADPSPFITREMDLKVFRSAVQSADDARHVYLSVPVARSVVAAVAARDAEIAKLRAELAAEKEATVPYREVEAWLSARRDACLAPTLPSLTATTEAAAIDDMLDDFNFCMETGTPLTQIFKAAP